MLKLNPNLIRFGQFLLILILSLTVFLGITQWTGGVRPAHALPEFADRTGEPCATCHVNPGGGGPRTLRGSLWAARGRPDAVPAIPGLLIAPGVTSGQELYDIACAGCHGRLGEGLFAIELVGTGVPKPAIRSFVIRGILPFGMPSFEGQFTDEQLDALVDFVAGVSNGEIELLDYYALPSAQLNCEPISSILACGGK